MAPRASVEGISMLQDQYVAGRLDLEEFEARVAAVLRWRDEMVERGLLPWTGRGGFPLRSGQLVSWVQEWARTAGDSRTQSDVLQANRAVADKLGEAWDWLCVEGLLGRAVLTQPNPDAFRVTRRGREALEYIEPLAMLRAQRRLGIELHSRLAARLRPLIQVGAFEQAAFDALREVEVRVREHVGDYKRAEGLVGVKLMRYAFSDKGLLGIVVAEPGERQGLGDLFAGAFGAVRNPLGHRTVEWDDATEAAEMVLLADLLMRQLDRLEPAIAFQREMAAESDFDPDDV